MEEDMEELALPEDSMAGKTLGALQKQHHRALMKIGN